jgi:hypothetical protein
MKNSVTVTGKLLFPRMSIYYETFGADILVAANDLCC